MLRVVARKVLEWSGRLVGRRQFIGLTQTVVGIAEERYGYQRSGALSYSLEGEAILFRSFLDRYVHVWKLLDERLLSEGFYVDVGAHHPMHHSNTALLYQRGWRGINIDCLPGSMKAFREHRPEDINLEIAISTDHGECTYYVVRDESGRESPRSGFLTEERIRWLKETQNVDKIEPIAIRMHTLEDVLAQHLPQGCCIDLLNVDAEGRDLKVLQSNNWKKYRPTFVLVETNTYGVAEVEQQPEYHYLVDQGYVLLSKLGISCLYVKRSLQPKA